MRRIVLAVSVIAATVTCVLVSCSSKADDSAHSTTLVAPSSGVNSDQAPKILHPLDASKLVASPCLSLTISDLASLKIVNSISKPDEDAFETGCTWIGDSAIGISLGWDTVSTHGLSDLYARQSQMMYWVPTEVDGYPAIFDDPVYKQPPNGSCGINVGVNDHRYFFFTVDDPDLGNQACAFVAQAAADVIKNLEGAK